MSKPGVWWQQPLVLDWPSEQSSGARTPKVPGPEGGRVPQFIPFLKFSLTIPPLLNKMVNQADWLFLGPELLSSGWPRLERLTTTLTTCTLTSTKGIRHILETNFGRNAENVKNMASPSYLLHMIISEQERPGTLGRVCRVKYRALYGAKNCIICACRSSVAVQFSWHCNMASIQRECCSITRSVSLGPSEYPKKSRNIIIHWRLKPGDLNESSYSRSSLFSLNCKDCKELLNQ